MDSWENLLKRISADYFTNPERRLFLSKGEILMEQDTFNDRLYLVISGTCVGTIHAEDELGEDQQVELFEAGPEAFLGVNSFFSRTMLSSTRVTATKAAELAWIDHDTPPVNENEYGSIRKQFIPIIIEELSHRQVRLSRTAREREVALRRLHLAEQFSTLGQLSAGLAHELNNAVGVLVRTSDHLMHMFETLLRKHDPDMVAWFERGALQGQQFGSEMVRRRAKELVLEHGIPYDAAKTLARMIGSEALPELPAHLEEGLAVWETGRDCYDMQLAARHAAAIVKSVKQLGGGNQQRTEGIDVNLTLHEALSLLQSNLRQVKVEQHLETLPPIWGNTTELVQMWVNIIKNGWDALKEARTPSPRVRIATTPHRRGVEVVIANNGPCIPEPLRVRLFQPNITTKKGTGVTMGLGLGLYIVKRLVDSYSGELLVRSTPEETCFIIRLPLRHDNDTLEPFTLEML